ncbi:MAG TPA: hypothetical protein DCP10_02090 [Bacteroidales bacterium]|jgi:uncharacterized membrane protein YkvA (DUF1232 family)|nr:hypothetical protein [Bacteroidales bacterium]
MATKKVPNTSKVKKPTVKGRTTRPKSRAPNPEEAVKSPDFQQAKSKAEEYARDPEKAKKLFDEAMKKAKGKRKGQLDEVWMYLTALIHMARAYFNRQYTDVPWTSIVLVIAALIYFVSPFDFIPDILPVIGLTDDAVVIAFVVAQIKADLENFMAWEFSQQDKES